MVLGQTITDRVYTEPENSRYELLHGRPRHQALVGHEEQIGERGPEESPVDVCRRENLVNVKGIEKG